MILSWGEVGPLTNCGKGAGLIVIPSSRDFSRNFLFGLKTGTIVHLSRLFATL
jgi:hypothetical protein